MQGTMWLLFSLSFYHGVTDVDSKEGKGKLLGGIQIKNTTEVTQSREMMPSKRIPTDYQDTPCTAKKK